MRKVVKVMSRRCNKCGGECRLPEGPEQIGSGLYGLIDATFTTGFFSKALDDLQRFKFSLCESCVRELMLSFVVPAERFETDEMGVALHELPPLTGAG